MDLIAYRFPQHVPKLNIKSHELSDTSRPHGSVEFAGVLASVLGDVRESSTISTSLLTILHLSHTSYSLTVLRDLWEENTCPRFLTCMPPPREPSAIISELPTWIENVVWHFCKYIVQKSFLNVLRHSWVCLLTIGHSFGIIAPERIDDCYLVFITFIYSVLLPWPSSSSRSTCTSPELRPPRLCISQQSIIESLFSFANDGHTTTLLCILSRPHCVQEMKKEKKTKDSQTII